MQWRKWLIPELSLRTPESCWLVAEDSDESKIREQNIDWFASENSS